MKWYILVLSFLATVAVHAKTIVISDIDDTLKSAHVLSSTGRIQKAFVVNDSFLGMNWVLQELKVAQPDIGFFYVSNAPETLMVDFHKLFLVINNYPAGNLYLNQAYFTGDFKLLKIRQILASEKPDVVINFGDNGERDPEIYEQIRQEYPRIQFITYIHQAYSAIATQEAGKTLASGQIGFATSLDLLLNLYSLNLIPQAYLPNFLEVFAYSYDKEQKDQARMVIPPWMDCYDFKWSVNDSVFANNARFSEVKNRILKRCSGPSLSND